MEVTVSQIAQELPRYHCNPDIYHTLVKNNEQEADVLLDLAEKVLLMADVTQAQKEEE